MISSPPEFRAPETLQLIEQGLEDVSFSRPKTSLAWGVPVPGEEDTQTMYVWCDALTNYISTLGLLTDNKGAEWWNEADVTHVIGKDIARFHALIWPAMLKSAGLQVPPPQRLLIHGFLTSEGQKMSKSLGNVVVPAEAIAKYGVDPLRFYLSHEIPVGNDGDFSWKRFAELYDSKLRNQLGNLLNRVLVLLQKSGGGLASAIAPGAAGPIVAEQWGIYRTASDAFDTHRAIAAAMHVVEQLNGQMQTVQPWTKPVEEQREILSGFAEALRHVALMLLPFMPTTAQRISAQLGVPYADRMLEKSFTFGSLAEWGKAGDWTTVGTPAILFPKVD
jgi:methionyl-tRNA synthetase